MNPKNDKAKQQIYDFINEFINDNGVCPSYDEIAKSMGMAKSTVSKFVNRLADEGLIERLGRGRMVTKQNMFADYKMPIIGTVACGKPILAVEDIIGYMPIDKASLGEGEYFGLVAEGNSMIKIGVSDGDVVFVRRQQTADDGEIVVALIEDEQTDGERATLKRFFRDRANKRFILHPENDSMDDITVNNLRIIGVAKKVLKNLK